MHDLDCHIDCLDMYTYEIIRSIEGILNDTMEHKIRLEPNFNRTVYLFAQIPAPPLSTTQMAPCMIHNSIYSVLDLGVVSFELFQRQISRQSINCCCKQELRIKKARTMDLLSLVIRV